MFETDRTLKRVGIVGLGLIGGSFAKAYADAGIEVFAADIDERAMNAAIELCVIPFKCRYGGRDGRRSVG